MKQSLKKISCLVIVLIMITALAAGCNNSATTSPQGTTSATPATENSAAPTATPSPSPSTPAEKTVIKVWTANRSDADYAQAAIAQYNATNTDGIEIDYSIYADNYQQSLELAYSTGEAPDIFFDVGNFFATYVNQGYFLPIDQYLTPDYKARWGDGGFINGINVVDGKTYSLGAIGTCCRLVYNEDIFQRVGISAPPTSLKEMVDDANLISSKLSGEGIYGWACNLKSPQSGLQRSITPIVMRSGYPVKDGFDFSTGKFDFTAYKPVLDAYKAMIDGGGAFPGCESLDIDPLRAQFADGKIGMYISLSHAEPAVYANQFPTTENWSMAPVPTIDGTVKGSTDIQLSDKWLYINANTKNPDAAWKVMQFFYSDDYLRGYYEKGLSLVTIPSVLAIATPPDIIKKIPAITFGPQDQTWPTLPAGVTPEGENNWTVFASIVFGVEKNPDAAIADLNQRYNDAYDKAIADGSSTRIQYTGFDPANPGKSMAGN